MPDRSSQVRGQIAADVRDQPPETHVDPDAFERLGFLDDDSSSAAHRPIAGASGGTRGRGGYGGDIKGAEPGTGGESTAS